MAPPLELRDLYPYIARSLDGLTIAFKQIQKAPRDDREGKRIWTEVFIKEAASFSDMMKEWTEPETKNEKDGAGK